MRAVRSLCDLAQLLKQELELSTFRSVESLSNQPVNLKADVPAFKRPALPSRVNLELHDEMKLA